MLSFLVDYRVGNKHKTTSFESLKDAKSLIRCIRDHTLEFNVDKDKIIGSGRFMGGHLAAARALMI